MPITSSRTPLTTAVVMCSSRVATCATRARSSVPHLTAQIVITAHTRLAPANLLRAFTLSRTSLLSKGGRLLFRQLKDAAHQWEVLR